MARVQILVNGIRVNIYSTHLDSESSWRRTVQIRELLYWADNYPEQRIIAGDFNAWSYTTVMSYISGSYDDAWALDLTFVLTPTADVVLDRRPWDR